MKSGILYITVTLILTLSFASPNLWADASREIWNSGGLTTISDYESPMIHGTALVWEAKGGLPGSTSGGNDTEIFYCDLNTFNVIQITDDDDNDLLPQTDGNFVVWQKHTNGGENQIYLFDLQGQTGAKRISPLDFCDNYTPRIANGHVVWTSQKVDRSYEAGKVMFYDATHGKGPRTISHTRSDCSDPRIDSSRIIWLQETSNHKLSQWIYYIGKRHPGPRPAPRHLKFNRSNSSDGTQAVMVRRDGHDGEIFVYSRANGFSQITDNEAEDHSPVISRNRIAWLGNGIIHVADITDMMRVSGLKTYRRHKTDIIVCWDKLCTGDVEYHIDLSTTPDFSVYHNGIKDKSVGDVLRYRIKGLKPRTTYYIRVKAVINGSVTENSEVLRTKTR